MDEQVLLENCLEGNKAGWDEFMEKYSPLIYDSILRTFRRFNYQATHEMLADVHHDFIVYLLENDHKILGGFEGRNGCRFKHYLRTVVIRKTIDFLRKSKQGGRPQRVMSINSQNEAAVHQALPITSFEQDIDTRLILQAANEIFDELNSNEKDLWRMFFSEEMNPKDIAFHLGISVDCFYVRKQRLLRKLKTLAARKNLTF